MISGQTVQNKKAPRWCNVPDLTVTQTTARFYQFCRESYWFEIEVCWVTCFSTQCKLVYALKFADLVTSIGKLSILIGQMKNSLRSNAF